MKNCPKCNTPVDDNAVFCPNCGASVQPQPMYNQQAMPNGAPVPPAYVPQVNPYDHTAEFSPEEVSDNKLFALLVYLFDFIGVIIALLANQSKNSKYLSFHIKQSLKLTITEVMIAFITAVLCWTCIVPFAGAVCVIILLVVKIIAFIKTCMNKSVEVPIVRSLKFLN